MDAADEVALFREELALGELLDQIVISLDHKYGKGEGDPEIFIRLARTFHWEAFDRDSSKEDKRKNQIVSPDILEKRWASTVFNTEIDAPLRKYVDLHCPHDDREVFRKYILIKLIKMTYEQVYKKAWADHENLLLLKNRGRSGQNV
ncbi:MAG TPA: hypothetical protein VFC14_05620 [Burkholderiales bacterium]|jgi:hypothetical protein|nr:hypothetical protein [Burkholderiales bacterium]